MKWVIGYKAYNKGLVNQYNEKYEIGKEYVSDMEDVLRYYDGFKLTNGEIDYLADGRSESVQKFMSYYQYGDTNVFSR